MNFEKETKVKLLINTRLSL